MAQITEKRSIGAAMKYGWLLALTEDQQLYTAAEIAKLGFDSKKQEHCYGKAKKALWHFSRYHSLHESEDGRIGRYQAWYGWRWKACARPEDLKSSRSAASTIFSPPSALETKKARAYGLLKIFKNWKTGLRWTLPLACLAIFVGAGQITLQQYRDLKVYGPKHVIKKAEGQKSLNTVELHELATSYFRKGDFHRAYEITATVLGERHLSPLQEAQSFYLLGTIYSRWGSYSSALRNFENAEYSLSGIDPGHKEILVLVRTQQGIVLSQLGETEKGLEIFEELLLSTTNRKKKGFIHLYVADSYFWLQDIGRAIAENNKALELLKNAGDVNTLTNAEMNKAWLLALSGKSDESLEIVRDLESVLIERGDENRLFYLDMTRLLVHLTLGREVPPRLLFRVSEHSKFDAGYRRYFDFIKETYPVQIVENDPPPLEVPDPNRVLQPKL